MRTARRLPLPASERVARHDDLPLESFSLERQLHQIFETIADTIQSCGGDVLRMTGDVVVAKWRLPPPKVPVGQLHAQASSFDARAVVEASREASACAKLLLERLHDRVLFTDTSKEAIKKADAARIARFSKGGSFHSAVPDEDAPASEPSSAASPPKASKWGSAKALVRSKGGKLTQPSGRRMLDAVKAAQKGGVEFKLQLGAALTIACAQTMHVGGANSRWEYVSCANEISAAHVILTQVDSGELLVAESLWSAFPPTALQPHLVLDEWKRLPTQRIKGSVPDRAEEIVEERMAFMHSVPLGPMRQYCPGPIWGKIYAGDPDWIVSQSEVMMITVLMVRMFAPPNAPLHTQVAAYTAAVAIFQRALYEAMGTFKHMMQDSEGCTAVACFGLPPFKHSEVSDSRGAISVAVEMKKQLSKMGLDVHAAVLEGKAWVGTVGNASRREFAVMGEPIQLGNQMLGLATDERNIIVDGPTSQYNQTRYNFALLPMTIHIPGQLKQHAVLAITTPRQQEYLGGKTPTIDWSIAQWMRSHNKPLTSHLVIGKISDASKQQMREVFDELDRDGSGSISLKELLEAIEQVDVAEASSPRSLRYNVARMMAEMDHDSDGSIVFDEFLAMAAAANAIGNDEDAQRESTTQNLPLLLTAHTTRRVLQRELGEGFARSYRSRSPSPEHASPSEKEKLKRRLELMNEGDDNIDFQDFVELVEAVEQTKTATADELKRLFDSYAGEGQRRMNRRDYVRSVMFHRLSTASARAVELFLRMDKDRSGTIEPKEFHSVLKSLKLDPEQGFTSADGDALFEALDHDESGSLDYNELATILHLPDEKAKTLGRLKTGDKRRKKLANRRVSMAPGASPRVSPRSPRRGSMGSPASPAQWTRKDRRQSVNIKLKEAERIALSEGIMGHRRKSRMGQKTRAMQNLADEVETFYAQYRAMRMKLGPLPDPHGHLEGLLSKSEHLVNVSTSLRQTVLVHPDESRGAEAEREMGADYHRGRRRAINMGEVLEAVETPSTVAPTSVGSSSDAPAHPMILRRQGGSKFDALLPQHEEEESPTSASTGLSSAALTMTPSFRSPWSNHSSGPETESPVAKMTKETFFEPSDPVRSEPVRRAHSHRGSIAPAQTSPRRHKPGPPPSSQLPPLLPSRGTTPATPDSARSPGSFRQRWGDGTERPSRAPSQRDHQEHIRLQREPSDWQKKLRHEEHSRLLAGETETPAQYDQATRLEAYHLASDASGQRIEQELELGAFGNVGMGLGSPPRTPKEEKAMRNWTNKDDLSEEDAELLRLASRNLPNLMSPAEQLAWLAAVDPDTEARTSLASIVDILESHGVRKEFEEDGAAGLLAPLYTPRQEEEEVVEAPAPRSLPTPPAENRPEGSFKRPRSVQFKEGTALSPSRASPRGSPRATRSLSPRGLGASPSLRHKNQAELDRGMLGGRAMYVVGLTRPVVP